MLAPIIKNIGDEFALRYECWSGAGLGIGVKGVGPPCSAGFNSYPVAIGNIVRYPAYQSLGAFISAVLPTAFVLAGLILFILIVFGGLMVVINAGSGDAKHAEQGKSALTAALLGMAVVFCAWWIIKIVEFVTGIRIF